MIQAALFTTHTFSKQRLATFAATVVASATLCLATTTSAADVSCAAMIEATMPKPSAPYRGTQSIALAGGKTMDNKMVYIGGTMYMQIAGSTTWLGTPVGDLKVLAAETAKLTSNCKAGATELVGSTPTRVWTSQIKSPIDGALSEQKLWIGVNDGRVYRQKTADLDQRLFYDNVVAPVIAGK